MNFEEQNKWTDDANKDKENYHGEPTWGWDCGSKLDFDGGLLSVSSRFYPCGNDIFDGSVSFYLGDNQVHCREFSTRHIDILKKDVEKYVNDVFGNLLILISKNQVVFLTQLDNK